MESLIISTFRAIRSLFSPGMIGIFIVSILVTIASLICFFALSTMFFSCLGGYLQGHAGAALLPWVGSFGAGIIAWFLFPGIMPVIISFFDNRIALVIERNDYPASVTAYKPDFWPEFLHDMRFALIVIGGNILLLPLYVLMHVFAPILFYLINGYLLGREFFVMVGRRHIPVHAAEKLRLEHSRTVWVAGILLAVMATVPLANLLAPFWGIAVMVHLYHRFSATPPPQILLP